MYLVIIAVIRLRLILLLIIYNSSSSIQPLGKIDGRVCEKLEGVLHLAPCTNALSLTVVRVNLRAKLRAIEGESTNSYLCK